MIWDDRYGTDEYVYGTSPNEFLVSVVDQLPVGKVLSLGEGEGRNAVFLAERGFTTVAVDSSSVGLEKALRLAGKRGVTIEAITADLGEFTIHPASWDAIISIFCHLPVELRKAVHRGVVQGLRPGGMVVLEAYTPAQLKHGTGGPQSVDMLMTLDALREELKDLVFLHAKELEREVFEGSLHKGMSAVVQIVARKP